MLIFMLIVDQYTLTTTARQKRKRKSYNHTMNSRALNKKSKETLWCKYSVRQGDAAVFQSTDTQFTTHRASAPVPDQPATDRGGIVNRMDT